jgi:hypothetical protein
MENFDQIIVGAGILTRRATLNSKADHIESRVWKDGRPEKSENKQQI